MSSQYIGEQQEKKNVLIDVLLTIFVFGVLLGIILGIYYFVKWIKAKNKEEEKKARKEGLVTSRANPNNHDIYHNNKKVVF